MPPIVRRVFALCSAVSLVLCVAVALAWGVWDKRHLSRTLENPNLTSDAGFYVKLVIIVTPYWLGVLVNAALPLFWTLSKTLAVIEERRLDRVDRELCVACGYDLRASPARCPECGATGQIPASPGAGRGAERAA